MRAAGQRPMRLIVGLGNPDPEYQWTPHNLGFMAVDELANRNAIRVERPEGKALVGRGKIAGLLVMWDEVQLPFGTIRLDRRGSGGSHNGANSVISSVGTPEFARLRLGCGPDHSLSSRKEFVLRPMKKTELEIAAEMISEAGDAVETILRQGIDPAMNKYNRRKEAQPEEPPKEQ